MLPRCHNRSNPRFVRLPPSLPALAGKRFRSRRDMRLREFFSTIWEQYSLVARPSNWLECAQHGLDPVTPQGQRSLRRVFRVEISSMLAYITARVAEVLRSPRDIGLRPLMLASIRCPWRLQSPSAMRGRVPRHLPPWWRVMRPLHAAQLVLPSCSLMLHDPSTPAAFGTS